METFLQFAVLGLGSGSAYAIASLGMVQVYRGSGVLNLAHGAIAFASAAIFIATWREQEWPLWLSMAIAVAAGAIIGVLIEIWVMGLLKKAAPLVRMTATLGVFAILQQGVSIVLGDGVTSGTTGSFYPNGGLQIGEVRIGYDRLTLLAVAVALAVALWLLSTRTRYGITTTAVAENEFVASTMGVSPSRIARTNWALGGALAGLAGTLLLPVISVVTAPPLLFLVVPALAAAMIGRFTSIPWTVLGALLLGIGESLLVRYQIDLFPPEYANGWDKAFPFLVIVALLVLRGTPFPARAEVMTLLPKVRPAGVSVPVVVAAFAAAAVVTGIAGDDLSSRVSASAGLAMVGLSLVVVTGFAGQTSLAQMAIAGVGAVIAARLSNGFGWPFLVVAIVAMVACAIVGALVALPSLRTRGPTLAIATLGVGIAIEQVVLTNGTITLGGFSGTPIERPTLFGLAIDNVEHPQRFAIVSIVLLGLAGWGVANLRSGKVGRQLLAVRGSERAAASLGVAVGSVKVGAFAIASALAGLGGVMLGFRGDTVTYGQFGLLPSLNLLVFATIGGIGYVVGPMVGVIFAPGGLLAFLLGDLDVLQRWLVLASGVVLIAILVLNPDGIVGGASRVFALPERFRRIRKPVVAATRPLSRSLDEQALDIRGLRVTYGPVVALHNLDLEVSSGEIVGLIGPNGAGKTTALDAMSGFGISSEGSTRIGSTEASNTGAHRMARVGMARSFQHLELFDDLTVAENLAVGHERTRFLDWIGCLFWPTPPGIPSHILEAASATDLDLTSKPSELSQGQRRYLGVLRALATDPAVVLLDEPAAGLDDNETRALGDLLRRTADEEKVAFVLVDHDMDLIAAVCDRVVTLDFGSVIFTGTALEASESPAVRAAYVGEEIA